MSLVGNLEVMISTLSLGLSDLYHEGLMVTVVF